MISNDEQDGQHFLEWVNLERLQMGETIPLYSLHQIKNDQFLESLLYQLQPSFFKNLINTPFNYQTLLISIDQYLDHFHGQKLKRKQRNQMLKQQCINYLLKIVFYISVQSPIKIQFIERVLQLSNQTQGLLMNSLKNIEENIENVLEIKQILLKLQQLQEENDYLKDKIREKDNQSILLRETIQEGESSISKLIVECNKLKKEKNDVMEELGIHEINQYITLYKDIQNQNHQILQQLTMVEKNYKMLQQQHKELKLKINQDNLVIEHLNEQKKKLKLSNMWMEMSYFDDQNQDQTLKQNKILANIQRKSFEKNSHRITTSLSEDQQQIQTDKIRNYNSQLMKKLQQMYKKITMITEQLTITKEEKEKVVQENAFHKQIIGELKAAHANFADKYQETIC